MIRGVESSRILFHILNALVAAIWVYYAWKAYADFELWRAYADRQEAIGAEVPLLAVHELGDLLNVVQKGLLVLFYISRRRSGDVASTIPSVLTAHLGTWLPIFLVVVTPARSPALLVPCTIVMFATVVVGIASYSSLGRSWGILPANRGVKTGGLYRLVRHPIYANNALFNAAFVLGNASLRNALILVGSTLALYMRAIYEERILARDPAYVAYAERVRYRFVPGMV